MIQFLGCTEEEYLEFVREVEHRSIVRPAGYEHIPDVRNGFVVPVLISLVVGVAVSAVSYLLTPKPKLPSAAESASRRSGSVSLGGVSGLTNYAPTTGFDSLQDLATYGSIVPIAFTRQGVTPTGIRTGGLLISPQMVWSRVRSWGSFQVIEMVAVAGQGGMERPDQAGIFLGNNGVDSLYDAFYQFYWNGGFEAAQADSRLRGRNLRYGTLNLPPVPAEGDNAFFCPTRNGGADTGFCGAFTPSNQAEFGVYSAIPNGTPYRPNWEIISVLRDQDSDAHAQALTNQLKYVDPWVAANHEFGGIGTRDVVRAGMPGTGRNYARHCGIIRHNGFQLANPTEAQVTVVGRDGTYRTWNGAITTERTVQRGDTIEVVAGYFRQDPNGVPPYGSGAALDLSDIRSTLDSEAVQHDALLKPGEVFMIGRSAWQVRQRRFMKPDGTGTTEAFNAGAGYIFVTMECIETWSANQNRIGICAPAAIGEQRWIPGNVDISESFYPICRVKFGTVRNTRRADVTEIGLRSQVWTQFNGITNFNTVPRPRELYENYNARDVQVREGKNTGYGKRTSFFAVDVRPADSETVRAANGNEGFEVLGGYLFCVTGSTPQDQFNFIRIRHPQTSEYEFRLRPLPSTAFTLQTGGNEDIIQLDAGNADYQEWTTETSYGRFTVGARGRLVKPRDLFLHMEMVGEPDSLGQVVNGVWRETGEPQSVSQGGVFSNVDNRPADWKKISNILSVQIGEDPFVTQRPVGSRRTFDNWEFNRDGFYVRMRLTVECFRQDLSGTVVAGRNLWWRIIEVQPIGSSGIWQNGQRFNKNAVDAAGEQWRFEYTVTGIRQQYIPYAQPQSATRIWEQYSAVAEVSHYGSLISRSCDNGPEHQVIYVNESLAEDSLVEYKNCAMVGLKLQSSANITQLDQLRVYLRQGVHVERLTDGDTGPSNLITDLIWYLCTNVDTGAGRLMSSRLVDRAQLAETGRYLRANGLFFDDVISEPINLRSWIAEKAPSMLCHITIRDGQLAINPSLPFDANFRISDRVPADISAMFTDGNIIEGSFQLEWLELEERQMFQAAVIYKNAPVNRLPSQETVVVRYADAGSSELPLEEFNLPHVTSREHAILAAKYFLAVRRHVTHTVSFRTLPYGLSLAPGDYIMVSVQQSPYRPTNNGIIRPNGNIVCAQTIADGDYSVYFWERGQPEVQEGQLQVRNGIAQNLRNTIFAVRSSFVENRVYMVEAIDVDEDGIVGIKASDFPVDANGVSRIAINLLNESRFEVLGEGD